MRFLFSYIVLLSLLIHKMLIRPVIVSYSITITKSLDSSIMFALHTCGNHTMFNIVIIYKKKKVL